MKLSLQSFCPQKYLINPINKYILKYTYILKYISEDESLKILVILQIHTRDQLWP